MRWKSDSRCSRRDSSSTMRAESETSPRVGLRGRKTISAALPGMPEVDDEAVGRSSDSRWIPRHPCPSVTRRVDAQRHPFAAADPRQAGFSLEGSPPQYPAAVAEGDLTACLQETRRSSLKSSADLSLPQPWKSGGAQPQTASALGRRSRD